MREIHRRFGEELRAKDIPSDQYAQLRSLTRDIRDNLETAFAKQDMDEIRPLIEGVLKHAENPAFKGTSAEQFFEIARSFLATAEKVDLNHQQEYAAALREVEGILFHTQDLPGLLGPRPDEPQPLLVMLRYGATRWDQAQQLLDRFLWVEEWVEEKPGEPLVMRRTPRASLFPEPLQPLFAYVEQNADKMLRPKFTVYWQFFIDDNVNGHYFGGVGPEILGTLFDHGRRHAVRDSAGHRLGGLPGRVRSGRPGDANHPHVHQHAGGRAEHRVRPVRPGVLRVVPVPAAGLSSPSRASWRPR